MIPYHFFITSVIFVYTLGGGLLLGQESPKKMDDTKRVRVSLIPVGDFPVSGAIIVNDRPVMVDPDPSELVPTPIYVKVKKKYKSMNLIMNSPSESWYLPAGGVIAVLNEAQEETGKYFSVKLSDAQEDLSVFLLRNQESKSWLDRPRTVIVKNGLSSFPLGSVRIINFSQQTVIAMIGKKRYSLKPQSIKVVRDLTSKNDHVIFPYRMVAKFKNKNYRLTNTAVKFNKKSRMNLIIYNRDGKSKIKLEGDDRPIKVVKYFELPYKAPLSELKKN